jgi:hypothetical protein
LDPTRLTQLVNLLQKTTYRAAEHRVTYKLQPFPSSVVADNFKKYDPFHILL